MEKKEAARLLFMEGWSNVDIAKMLGLGEHTVGKWATAGDWKAKRMARGLFEQTSAEMVQELILYQLEALKRQKDNWLAEAALKQEDDQGQTLPAESLPPAEPTKNKGGRPRTNPPKEPNLKFIERGDVYALQQLFGTIKRNELKWDDIVRILRRFTSYLEARDLTLAKAVIERADAYLNEVRREMS